MGRISLRRRTLRCDALTGQHGMEWRLGRGQFCPCSARLRPAKRPYTAKHGRAVSHHRTALHNQSGGVCNAKYPKSWIVNIAAQMISIHIKARVLNLTTPPQSARIVALGEAFMRRLPHFEMLTSLFLPLLPREHRLEPPTWLRSALFQYGSKR